MDAQKQIRENTQELHDFLKDLQDWERTVKNKDQELRSATKSQEKQIPPVRKNRATVPRNAAKHTYDYFKDKWDKFDVDAALREVDADDQIKHSPEPPKEDLPFSAHQAFSSSGNLVSDAAEEKENGNEFFKEKKYVQAIECYSRSIGLYPTAVAYANRAMALLKIRRYEDAEVDCSEAIALDDRYTKAYARRGTARRERNKLLEAVEDFEFALRLEPQNKELKKQYEEAKVLYEKKNPFRPAPKKIPLEVRRPSASALNEKVGDFTSAKDPPTSAANEKMELPTSVTNEKMELELPTSATTEKMELDLPKAELKQEAVKKDRKQAVQDAAARAAAAARSAVVLNMTAPKTSYEFETLWRGCGEDYVAKARLIKLMDPTSYPRVFRDFLSASLLMDILTTINSAIDGEDSSFAVHVVDNLTRVGRFSMTVMCLSPKDKSTVQNLLEKLVAVNAISSEKMEELRRKYRA